jgi:hypothetical protein
MPDLSVAAISTLQGVFRLDLHGENIKRAKIR